MSVELSYLGVWYSASLVHAACSEESASPSCTVVSCTQECIYATLLLVIHLQGTYPQNINTYSHPHSHWLTLTNIIIHNHKLCLANLCTLTSSHLPKVTSSYTLTPSIFPYTVDPIVTSWHTLTTTQAHTHSHPHIFPCPRAHRLHTLSTCRTKHHVLNLPWGVGAKHPAVAPPLIIHGRSRVLTRVFDLQILTFWRDVRKLKRIPLCHSLGSELENLVFVGKLLIELLHQIKCLEWGVRGKSRKLTRARLRWLLKETTFQNYYTQYFKQETRPWSAEVHTQHPWCDYCITNCNS